MAQFWQRDQTHTSKLNLTQGKVYTKKEAALVERLQANNLSGSAIKSQENKVSLYMSCTTKNNILILIEIVLVKSNHIWCEVKYKSESGQKEVDFEYFLTLLLSDVEVPEECEEMTCR